MIRPLWETIPEALQTAMDLDNDQAVKILVHLALSTEYPMRHQSTVLDVVEKACSWFGWDNNSGFNENELMGIILKRREQCEDFYNDLERWWRETGGE